MAQILLCVNRDCGSFMDVNSRSHIWKWCAIYFHIPEQNFIGKLWKKQSTFLIGAVWIHNLYKLHKYRDHDIQHPILKPRILIFFSRKKSLFVDNFDLSCKLTISLKVNGYISTFLKIIILIFFSYYFIIFWATVIILT